MLTFNPIVEPNSDRLTGELGYWVTHSLPPLFKSTWSNGRTRWVVSSFPALLAAFGEKRATAFVFPTNPFADLLCPWFYASPFVLLPPVSSSFSSISTMSGASPGTSTTYRTPNNPPPVSPSSPTTANNNNMPGQRRPSLSTKDLADFDFTGIDEDFARWVSVNHGRVFEYHSWK